MGSLRSKSAVWEAIDLSESFLICGMFDDAASLSSSALRRLHIDKEEQEEDGDLEEEIERPELEDMIESAAMVLVQSLKELGRTNDIFSELEGLCGSVSAFPCRVVMTGACMQLSEGFSSNLKSILEHYLGLWKVEDEQSLVLKIYDMEFPSEPLYRGPCLSMKEYLQLVDFYVFQFLGSTLGDVDSAIAWTMNAEIPEANRQDLLMKLHSLYMAKSSKSSALEEKVSDLSNTDGMNRSTEVHAPSQNSSKFAMLRAVEPCFWWHRMVHLKCGNNQLVFSCGKAATLGIIILVCYILRKKWSTARRMASRQFKNLKKALTDAWQLAFSVQVNPLAAVQQPLTAGVPLGSR